MGICSNLYSNTLNTKLVDARKTKPEWFCFQLAKDLDQFCYPWWYGILDKFELHGHSAPIIS